MSLSRQHARAMTGKGGFTLIEVILVVSIMAIAYAVAMPNVGILSGTGVSVKLGTLAGDIRSAFDVAVLSGKPHRIVFEMGSGRYWLEVSSRRRIYLSDEKVDRDPTADELADQMESFKIKFEEYEKLAGTEVYNPKTDKPLKPTSPLLQAKALLSPDEWTKVENQEWSERNLGPELLISDFQTSRHNDKQKIEDLGPKTVQFLYFFPRGYVERALIHIAYAGNDGLPDPDEKPYTLLTLPSEGTATIESGYIEWSEALGES